MGLVDVVVIGAGVSGLSCARELQRAGRDVVVLDKSRGVGGRCATRRIEGQPVDMGVTFLHGSDRRFLQALHDVGPGAARPWPVRVSGEGPWCSPRALAAGEERVVFPAGLTTFPKHLAADLDVRLQQHVSGIGVGDGFLTVVLVKGEDIRCRHLVLALPMEQARDLLESVFTPTPDIRGAMALMRMASSSSCLALAALYDSSTPDPGFDVCHPSLESRIAIISHDSSKRLSPVFRVLVLQARTGWSRRHLDVDNAEWSAELLDDAAGQLGDWVRRPRHQYAHRWRFARIDGAPAFHGPVLLPLGGAKLGLTGEGFSEGGGVQGAYLAGLDLAERLLEKM